MTPTNPQPASAPTDHYIDPPAVGAAAPHFQTDPVKSGRTVGGQPAGAASTVASVPLRESADKPTADAVALDKVGDVELDVSIELGRTEMALEDVAKLQPGMVVTLDTLVGDLVDVVVNGRLVARGEVVVVDDNFCVRVVELITGSEAA